MIPKFKLNVGPREQLFGVLVACVFLTGGAMLTRTDLFTIVLICSAVFVVTAITGCYLPYFRPGIFGPQGSLKRPASKPLAEESAKATSVTTKDTMYKPDCLIPEDPPPHRLGSESLLDVAVDRIIRGMDRDLEMRR